MKTASRLLEFASCAWNLGDTLGRKSALFWRQTKNVRVRAGLASYHPQDVYTLATRYGTVHLRDNFGDVTNLPDLFHRNVYRISAFPGEGAVLDIGANIGLVAALVAWHNPQKAIHCFEPLPTNVRMIRLNCPAARIEQACVGSRPSTLRLRVDPDGVMATSIDTQWKTEEMEFPVIRLDDYAAQHGIRDVAFLKMDTEGMELDVMDGAKETLRRTARVAMETHGPERHRDSIARLRDAGFSIAEEYTTGSTGFVLASR